MMQIKFYKRSTPTPLPPPNFYYRSGEVTSDENDPKNAEIRRSAEQSHPWEHLHKLQLNILASTAPEFYWISVMWKSCQDSVVTGIPKGPLTHC